MHIHIVRLYDVLYFKRYLFTCIIWNSASQRAFDTLKDALVGHSVRKLPESDGIFAMIPDSNDVTIGVLLCHEFAQELQPVACHSSIPATQYQQVTNM